MSTPSRQLDPETTRREILDAAQELFVEKGFSGTSINAVATQAGVTKSLIFHHFGSKENLWSQMATRLYQRYHDIQMELMQKPSPDLYETLVASIKWHFDFLKQHPEALRLEMWEGLDGIVCKDKPDDVVKEGLKRFREGQEKGTIRKDIPPTMLMVTFLNMARHWFFAKAHLGEHLNLNADGHTDDELDELYLESMIKIYLEGVLPRDSPPVDLQAIPKTEG